MKVIYRRIYTFCIVREFKAGNLVRICDKLLEKVYKIEDMCAADFIEIIETEDDSRYECWVVEKSIEDEINEEKN